MPHDPAVEQLRTQILGLIREHLPLAQESVLLALPRLVTQGSPAAPATLPWEALTEGLTDSLGQSRPAYAPLALACALRARDEARAAGGPDLDPDQLDLGLQRLMRKAEALRRDPTATPVQLLWHAWICGSFLRLCPNPAIDEKIAQLWSAAFGRQHATGHLHHLDVNAGLDAFVYDEFAALHAAANLAAEAARHGNVAWYSPIHRLALYHLENTQPDNTTHQPWGIAAFAMFGDTQSMAEQQLHDARAALVNRRHAAASPVTLALLADAWVTLRAN